MYAEMLGRLLCCQMSWRKGTIEGLQEEIDPEHFALQYSVLFGYRSYQWRFKVFYKVSKLLFVV